MEGAMPEPEVKIERFIANGSMGIIPQDDARVLLADLAFSGLDRFTAPLRDNLSREVGPGVEPTPLPYPLILTSHQLAAVALQGDLTGRTVQYYNIRVVTPEDRPKGKSWSSGV